MTDYSTASVRQRLSDVFCCVKMSASLEELFLEMDHQIEDLIWENRALQEIAQALRFGDIIITATDGKMTNVRVAHNMRSPDRNRQTAKS